MITFVLGILILLVGYLSYSRFIDKTFAPDDRPTPAHKYRDNVDFIPMSKK
jgi:carbon starvation protein CstA